MIDDWLVLAYSTEQLDAECSEYEEQQEEEKSEISHFR